MRRLIAAIAFTLFVHPAFADVTAHVFNSPGWLPSTSYSVGARVLAGPGWDPVGQTFTNGSAVYEWALAGSGGTSSASQPAGFASCPSPTNYGGGFNGTAPSQWLGHTTVSDNGLTWYCLVKVDYNSITGWFYDTGAYNTTSGTGYFPGDYVLSDTPTRIYRQMNTSIAGPCATAGVSPTGTGSAITDGTCTWAFVNPLNYSSQASFIPKDKWGTGIHGITQSQLSQNYFGVVGYGGSNLQEYLAGSNGELSAFVFQSVNDFYFDTGNFSEGSLQCLNGQTWFACAGAVGSFTPFAPYMSTFPVDSYKQHP